MDLSIAKFLAAFPGLEPYLMEPLRATCHQGAQSSSVILLATRGDALLYADSGTQQFGIAFQSAARHDHVFAGRQYPSVELAVSMFLGDRAALDPD